MATVAPAGLSDPSASILRLSAKGRAVFTPAGWNAAVRNAGQQAIGFWLATIAHKRFNWHYAQRELPYRPGRSKTSRHFRYKEEPFVSTGQLKNNLFMRSKLDVRAKRGGLTSMKLRVPIGHWMKAETIAAFKFIPAKERAAVAREFRKALIQQLQAQRAKASAKAQAKAERTARAAANKVKREASAQRTAANRAAKERASSASARSSQRMEERRARKAADHAAKKRAAAAGQRSAERRKANAWLRRAVAQDRRMDRLSRRSSAFNRDDYLDNLSA